MSNWGVAQPGISPVIVTAGADTACPAGTETNTINGTFAPPGQGVNYALSIAAMATIVLGATPPSAMVIAVRNGAAGADFDTYTVPPAALVASAVLNLAPLFVGTFSRAAYGASFGIFLSVNPTGQAVTFKANSRMVLTSSISSDA